MVKLVNRITAFAAAVVLAGVVGCSSQSERLNAPPQGSSERVNPLSENFTAMGDNAAQRDASLADSHFEPYAAELSGLGVWRITRIGDTLTHTGGIIRYETAIKDQDLVNARLQSVRDFLAASGYDTDRIKVESGLSRNAGGSAAVSIEGRNRVLSASAVEASGGAQTGGPMGPQ